MPGGPGTREARSFGARRLEASVSQSWEPAARRITVTTAESRTFDVRHVQLARAAFAAIAALMITFSSDHSAAVGSAVFSGFAIATGFVHLLAAWLVYPAGRRWPSIALGVVAVVAGMATGLFPLRTVTGFFVTVIAWALVSGVLELVAGWRGLL